ncbi:MAG: PAS domain S-box protein, partial [Anaerolineales bacterium]|nr:PAS domain S-box protein [Anaerolineales bacterium]
ENIYQWTAEEVVGKNIQEVTPSSTTQQQANEIMKILAKDETWAGEFEVQRKNGTIFLADITNTPIHDEKGQLIGIVGVSRDITRRKKIELVLRENEERYRTLFESNPHPMWVYELESLAFLAVNDAAIHQYGYSRAEFLSMTIKDIRPGEDIPVLLKNISQVSEGLDEAGVWRHQKKDGALIEVEIISHVLHWAGKRAELVLANDITDRRQSQRALREAMRDLKQSEDRFLLLFEQSPIAYELYDPDGYLRKVNSSWKKLWNTDPPPPRTYNPLLDSQVDTLGIKEEIAKSFEGEHIVLNDVHFDPAQSGLPGIKRWLRTSAYAIKDKDGKVMNVVVNHEDITDRKQAEKEIMLKMAEIERINDIYVGREGKMIDLKREINALLEELGRPAKYSSPGDLDELPSHSQ